MTDIEAKVVDTGVEASVVEGDIKTIVAADIDAREVDMS